jgi:AbrB family looped-hinge helix DNA binding protein
MDTIVVSSNYQVVIPRSVRERMKIRSGERLEVIGFDNRIELIRLRPMRKTRGFLKGLDPSFQREEGERD